MVCLPYSRFGNENFFGSLGFSPTIGKDDADSEVVSKQVAAVADVTFATHGNPEISSVCECHEIH